MRGNKKGFTIVELSLASAFLGILLITIALLVTHIITIYQKGMTLKSVNEIGEDLIDEFSRSITASTPIDLSVLCDGSTGGSTCVNDKGQKLLYQQNRTNVKIVRTGETVKNAPTTGAFCTGKYSYIWNSGYILDDDVTGMVYSKPGNANETLAGERATLALGSGSNRTVKENFRLLKVQDAGREVCASGIRNGSYATPGKSYQVSNADAEVTELLEKSEDNLALYSLDMFVPAYHTTTRHAFYSGTFILATIRGGVNITAAGDYCTDTSDTDSLSSDFAYCAMNKFNFAARATGGENL